MQRQSGERGRQREFGYVELGRCFHGSPARSVFGDIGAGHRFHGNELVRRLRDDGTFRWVSWADEPAWRTIRAVTDDVIYVITQTQVVTALDRTTGRVLSEAPPPPPLAEQENPPVIEVDGVQIRGEQISRVWATDASGVELWTRPGGWVYGDVWAIDDGAVFAVENHSDLVAYDIRTGAVRWAHRGDAYAEGLWPWHAEGQRLSSMW